MKRGICAKLTHRQIGFVDTTRKWHSTQCRRNGFSIFSPFWIIAFSVLLGITRLWFLFKSLRPEVSKVISEWIFSRPRSKLTFETLVPEWMSALPTIRRRNLRNVFYLCVDIVPRFRLFNHMKLRLSSDIQTILTFCATNLIIKWCDLCDCQRTERKKTKENERKTFSQQRNTNKWIFLSFFSFHFICDRVSFGNGSKRKSSKKHNVIQLIANHWEIGIARLSFPFHKLHEHHFSIDTYSIGYVFSRYRMKFNRTNQMSIWHNNNNKKREEIDTAT